MTTLARAGVNEIWLMSKSNDFGPGANDFENGTYTHFTWAGFKPSCVATA